MSAQNLLLARIDSDLVNSVIVPAVKARLDDLRACELGITPAQIETAYVLVRLQAAMKQDHPCAYIRQPGPQQLANAARHAKKESEVAHGH